MIAKQRTVPIRLIQDEALLRRLDEKHEKRSAIEEDLAKRRAGFYGEKSLDYYYSFLDDKNYVFLHDLRLTNGQYYFQIDTLIICPHYVLIIEVKHISGTLLFDHMFNQLIRYTNGKEERLPNPLIQARHQQHQIKEWLRTHHFKNIPIDYLIVSTHPTAILKSTSSNPMLMSKVCHSENFLGKIHDIERKFNKDILMLKEVKRLARKLAYAHTPLDTDILLSYSLSKSDVKRGVQCPKCHIMLMKRQQGKWYCDQCKTVSVTAHEQAVYDYFLLIKSTITNQECCDFLMITSQNISRKILHSMPLGMLGENKNRMYRLEKMDSIFNSYKF